MAIQSLTRAELLAVLRCARETSERDWLMILLAFWHGLRSSEVCALTRDAVADGFLRVKRLKGSLPTTQPLVSHEDPLLNEAQGLFEYLQNQPFNQRLFPVTRGHFWRRFQRYAKQAGIPKHKRHPHVLKHTIGTELCDSSGVPITQAWLGHKSGNSTLQYTKKTEQQAAAAVRTLLR